MKIAFATTLIALGLLTSAASAYPNNPASSYPEWAQNAFERSPK